MSSSAQLVPGGIGSLNEVTDEVNVVAWWDANDLRLTNNARVSEWVDKVNETRLVQSQFANQPFYRTNGIGGKPSVYFDGVTFGGAKYLLCDVFNHMPSSEITAFVVYKSEKKRGNTLISYAASWWKDEFVMRNYDGNNGSFSGFIHNTNVNGNTGNWIKNQNTIATLRWRGTGGDTELYRNNTEEKRRTINNNGTLRNLGKLIVGTRQTRTNVRTEDRDILKGHIAEIILFDGYLNEAQMSVVSNYLEEKYGPFPNFAKDGFDNMATPTFSYDFVGLGVDTDGIVEEVKAGGIGFMHNSSMNTGDYIYAAHNNAVNNASTINNGTEVTANGSATAAWNREFLINRIGTFNPSIIFDLESFENSSNLSDVADYVLLYRVNQAADYSIVSTTSKQRLSSKMISFDIANNNFSDGFYTLGTTDQATAPLNGHVGTTWYSWGNGNWEDYTVWSTEENIQKNDDQLTPDTSPTKMVDKVVIKDGSEIVINNDGKSNSAIEVKGTLRLGETKDHAFDVIAGNGYIQLQEDHFPDGDATRFCRPELDDGTVILAGNGFDITNKHIFSNVIVNLNTSNNQINLLNDIDIRGNLTLRRGVLKINKDADNQNLTIDTRKDVHVQSNASIITATSNSRHEWNFYGNLLNDGSIKFTNRTGADMNNEATDGIVDANFINNNSDQLIQLNASTIFYRIEIDKGVDDTYTLSIDADDVDHFKLYGYFKHTNAGIGVNASRNDNALGLITGTVRLGANIKIDELAAWSYNIPRNARLLIDGANVNKSKSTATLLIYGRLEINSGYLKVAGNHGFTLREEGSIKVSGGVIDVNAIKTSILGANHQGSYTQTGGVVNIGIGKYDWIPAEYYRFTLPYENNVFTMSGGELNIISSHHDNRSGNPGILINAKKENINVTGGKVQFEILNDRDFIINTKAPFYDLELKRTAGENGRFVIVPSIGMTNDANVDVEAQSLHVLNNLTLRSGTEFSPINDLANADVYIGGTFICEENATYNTMHVDGGTTNYQNTIFDNTIGTSDNEYIDVKQPLSFGRLTIDRMMDQSVIIKGVSSANNGTTLAIIKDLASINSGILDQNRFSMQFRGNVINNGQCGTYFKTGTYPVAGGTPENAFILIEPDQNISLTTNESSSFGNVRINCRDDNQIELNSNAKIERLHLSSGAIYIKSHKLTLDQLTGIADNESVVASRFYQNVTNNSDLIVNDNGVTAKRLIYSDGNASDGGVSIKLQNATVTETNSSRTNNSGPITFPIGYTTDGGSTIYYRPAQLKVKTFHDEGYVTINVASGEIQTSNLSGGEILQTYWKVSHDEFETVPKVGLRFAYRDQTGFAGVDKIGGATQESNYVPGYVMTEEPYTRFAEDHSSDITNTAMNGATRYITFNGSSNNGNFDQSAFEGFDLTNAYYTCGQNNRFEGKVRVFYTRDGHTNYDNIVWGDLVQWARSATWYQKPDDLATVIDRNSDNVINHIDFHDSRNAAANDYPRAGDIAVIGFIPWSDQGRDGINDGGKPDHRGMPHYVWVNSANTCAEVKFSAMEDSDGNPTARKYRVGSYIFRPTLIINNEHVWNGSLSNAVVKGEGTIWVRGQDPNISDIDFSLFAKNDSSYIVYENFAATQRYNNMPDEMPNFLIANNGWGRNDHNVYINKSIKVNGNFEMSGNINVHLNDLLSGGDITIAKNLHLYEVQASDIVGQSSGGGAKICFPRGNDRNRKLTVLGNVEINNTNARIEVANANGGFNTHEFIVHGDINIDATNGGFDFYNGNNRDYINLIFAGDDNSSFNQVSGMIPDLNQLIINKGNDNSKVVTINTDFNLGALSNGNSESKALQLQNGTLILNNTGININLTTGGEGFSIPSTTMLHLKKGVINADGNSHIDLNGHLKIEGGSLDMKDGDNSIIYYSSGNAVLEINDGRIDVGGQIRGGIGNDENVLKYIQSGGNVEVGQHVASENGRGVFEIHNEGSSYTHTAGELRIIRPQAAAIRPALYLLPYVSNVSDLSRIVVGHSTIADNSIIDIRTNVTVPNLLIDNPNNRVINVNIATEALRIKNKLTINGENTTFHCGNNDLYVGGDIENNGSFTTDDNTTFFNGTDEQRITGNKITNFNNLTQSNNNTLSLTHDMIVNGDLLINGTLIDDDNTIQVKKNVENNGVCEYGGAGAGMTFNGSELQNITGNGSFGKINIDNAANVKIDGDYDITINNALLFTRGVLDIGSNLLTINEDCDITAVNSFAFNNMIQTTKAYVDAGVRKMFDTHTGATYSQVIPIGSNGVYTPVEITVENISKSGSIIVKASNERHPTIVQDDETPDEEIDDFENVLQYYWILRGNEIEGFTGNIKFYANDELAKTQETSSYDQTHYKTARLLNNGSFEWEKFEHDTYDEANDVLTFDFSNADKNSISGDYTAGVEPAGDHKGAIPDRVPVYKTIANGFWDNPAIWDKPIPTGSNGPRGSIVEINHDVEIRNNGIVAYIMNINDPGRLSIKNTKLHRFGEVRGHGTLVFDEGLVPSGIYDDFTSADGGTIIFQGTESYQTLSNWTHVNHIVFKGTGNKRLPNRTITINGDFTIAGENSLLVTNFYNQTYQLKNDMTLISGKFDAGSGNNATFVFSGSNPQEVTGAFTGNNAFNNLRINNASGLTINNNVEIKNKLELSSGLIHSTGDKLLTITNSAFSAVIGGSDISYVDGPLSKKISNASSFDFPIGHNGRYGNVTVKDVESTGSGFWTANYYNYDATIDGFDADVYEEPLQYVSKSEYWKVKGPNNCKANITLRWDKNSGMPLSATERSKTNVAEWLDKSTDAWNQVGNTVNDISAVTGSVSTDTKRTFNEWTNGSLFTISTTLLQSPDQWIGNTSNWFDVTNWADGTIPSISTDVVINKDPVGSHYPILNGSAFCNKLTIGTDAHFTIEEGSQFTINNMINNGELIVKNSTATNKVSSIIINDDISRNGGKETVIFNFDAMRYFYIAPPLGQIKASVFNAVDTDNTRLYEFKTSTNKWQNIADNNYDFNESMKGYTVMFKENRVVTMSGQLHNNDYTKMLSRGWNLVCNPYMSWLDLDQMYDSNRNDMDQTVYTRTTVGGTRDLATYNLTTKIGLLGGSKYIAPMQSYWVRVTGTSYNAEVAKKNRVHHAGTLKTKNNRNDVLKLQVSAGDVYDQTAIVFDNNYSKYYTSDDSRKKIENNRVMPYVYSFKDEKQTAIALRPIPAKDDSICLGFKFGEACDDLIRIEAIDSEEFLSNTDAFLIDKIRGEYVNLMEEAYVCQVTPDQTINERFVIRFKEPKSDIITNLKTNDQDKIRIYVANNEVTVKIDNFKYDDNAKIKMYDTQGRLLHMIDKVKSINKMKNYQDEIVIVEILYNNKVTSQKVVTSKI